MFNEGGKMAEKVEDYIQSTLNPTAASQQRITLTYLHKTF